MFGTKDFLPRQAAPQAIMHAQISVTGMTTPQGCAGCCVHLRHALFRPAASTVVRPKTRPDHFLPIFELGDVDVDALRTRTMGKKTATKPLLTL